VQLLFSKAGARRTIHGEPWARTEGRIDPEGVPETVAI
jgi:hypothetical protein